MIKIPYVAIFLLLLLPKTGFSQESGIIVYEDKRNLHRNLKGDREDLKALLPEFRSNNYQLAFDGSTSLYKPAEVEELDNFSSGNSTVRVRQAKMEIYCDLSSRVRTLLREYMGKNYLMQDTLSIPPWKIDNVTKTIAGYTCQMAYYSDTSRNMEITAWFTTELPPFIGPDNFNTLPGTVLAVDINNEERVLVARTVNLREPAKYELKKPEKGIEVTIEEYEEIVREQTEKMRQQGAIMIRN